ncbi:hypothetical protein E2C01_022107 [Portunus trituberculatus]|uniref:Uncharacterized protein n=1 Tax=Portunus trituberculatus TaxID=210409 RepID=A0A5B7E811_PORTR|nr:hypothetical protein [Portunus trituberculatus]
MLTASLPRHHSQEAQAATHVSAIVCHTHCTDHLSTSHCSLSPLTTARKGKSHIVQVSLCHPTAPRTTQLYTSVLSNSRDTHLGASGQDESLAGGGEGDVGALRGDQSEPLHAARPTGQLDHVATRQLVARHGGDHSTSCQAQHTTHIHTHTSL